MIFIELYTTKKINNQLLTEAIKNDCKIYFLNRVDNKKILTLIFLDEQDLIRFADNLNEKIIKKIYKKKI